MLEKWYKECTNSKEAKLFKDKNSEFFIYKGFKIEKKSGNLELFDVRHNDFYDPVSKGNIRTLKAHGFIKGCDLIMHRRDCKRCKKYIKILEGIYKSKDRYQKELLKTSRRPFVEKKIRNADKNIQDNIDLLFFYDTRKEQIEIKLNIKCRKQS